MITTPPLAPYHYLRTPASPNSTTCHNVVPQVTVPYLTHDPWRLYLRPHPTPVILHLPDLKLPAITTTTTTTVFHLASSSLTTCSSISRPSPTDRNAPPDTVPHFLCLKRALGRLAPRDPRGRRAGAGPVPGEGASQLPRPARPSGVHGPGDDRSTTSRAGDAHCPAPKCRKRNEPARARVAAVAESVRLAVQHPDPRRATVASTLSARICAWHVCVLPTAIVFSPGAASRPISALLSRRSSHALLPPIHALSLYLLSLGLASIPLVSFCCNAPSLPKPGGLRLRPPHTPHPRV